MDFIMLVNKGYGFEKGNTKPFKVGRETAV